MTSTNDDTATMTVTQAARKMGEMGYKIVPIGPGTKYPNIQKWQERATADAATIEQWFGNADRRGLGVGWAMGRQPIASEEFLFCIDVDAHGVDGMANLIELIAANGGSAEFVSTTSQNTGNDGAHFVFSSPVEIRNSQNQIAPGVDVRGEGGQIVIAPTIHPDTGNPYAWAKPPWEVPPTRAPQWLIDLIMAPPPEPEKPAKQQPTLRADEGTTPAEWLRERWDWRHELEGQGWTYVGAVGDQEMYRRPGKTTKGHSAVVHRADNVLVCFSTETPAALMAAGRTTSDGSGVALSPFQFAAAMRFGGDEAACARAIRRSMPQAAPRITESDDEPAEPGQRRTMRADDALPPEFWERRPLFNHIRQAARATLVSPDALLVNVMARYAANIHPSIKLPAIVGSKATFDFICCVVANSSGGKTTAAAVAKDIFPADGGKRILMDLPVGSGEGLIQSYLVDEMDDDGKPTGRMVVGIDSAHISIDEGTALADMGSRQGTTILQTLCSAWSGATLGQANASRDTRRIVEAGRVRLAAAIGIQTSTAPRILSENLIAMGLPQRIVWATAHDKHHNAAETVPHPGNLVLPRHHTLTGADRVISVDVEIAEELRSLRIAVLRGDLVLPALDGHSGLTQLKVAGLLALMDNRTHITLDDWDCAYEVLDSSTRVRNHLLTIADTLAEQRLMGDQRHADAAEAAYVVEKTSSLSSDEIDLISDARDAYVEVIKALPKGEPTTPRALSLQVSSRYRPASIRDVALAAAAAEGFVKRCDDGRFAPL